MKPVLFLFVASACAIWKHAASASSLPTFSVPYRVGPWSCKRRCFFAGRCSGYIYKQENFQCTLILTLSRLQSRAKASPCGRDGCPRWHECVHTRTGPPVCVGLRVKTRHSRPLKVLFKKREGLLTVSSLGRRRKKINFYNLNLKKWFLLLTVKAMQMTALKSYGESVYWCHSGPTSCSQLKMRDGRKGCIEATILGYMGVDLAADEGRRLVFVALLNKTIVITSKLRVEKLSWKLQFTPRLMDVSPNLRLLFVAYQESRDVDFFNYKGERQRRLHLSAVSLQLFFDELNEVLYILFKKGIILQPPSSQFKIAAQRMVGQAIYGETQCVFPHTNSIIVVRKRVVQLINKHGNHGSEKPVCTLPYAKYSLGTPIAFFMSPVKEKRGSAGTTNQQSHVMGTLTRAPADTVLVATSYRHFTKLRTLELTFGNLKTVGEFAGSLDSLDIAGNVLFICQRTPTGLYRAAFHDGRLHADTERINDRPCTSVATDSEKKSVFYAMFTRVCRYNWESNTDSPLNITLKIDSRINVDKIFHALYLFKDESIARYSYRGKLQNIINVGNTYSIRDLVLCPRAQMVFFTDMARINVLLSADITPNRSYTLKAKKTVFPERITAFGVTKDLLVQVNNSTLKMFSRNTMQKADIGGGQFNLTGSIANIKLFSFGDL